MEPSPLGETVLSGQQVANGSYDSSAAVKPETPETVAGRQHYTQPTLREPTPTPTPPDIQPIIDACAATAADLKQTRMYASGLEAQNKLLQDRLQTEKQATAILTELNDTRRAEASALRSALEAKNETIAAKDTAIAAQDKLIADLKKKKPSPWRRLGDILIGAAVFAVLK